MAIVCPYRQALALIEIKGSDRGPSNFRFWHKADIDAWHIKRLLTGAKQTSHKHP
jgi:hypothetical protein